MYWFDDSLEIYGLQPYTPPSVLDVPSESSESSIVETKVETDQPKLYNAESSIVETKVETDQPKLHNAVSSKVETDKPKLYTVEVVQFWRGEKEHLRPYPLQWAIYVETSRGIGNTYQLVGDQTNYAIDIRLNQPLENEDNLRGKYPVGSVSPAELAEMETILPRVDIVHNIPWWNGQDWVDDALRYLKCWGFSKICGEAELSGLQERMCWQLESSPGINNAVEFVGYPDLACIVANKRSADVHQRFWMSRSNSRECFERLWSEVQVPGGSR